MTDPDQSSQSYDLTMMTAIRAGLWRITAEKEVLLLLAGLLTIITLLYYGLTMGNMFSALSASTRGEPVDPAAFQQGLGFGYWLGSLIFMFLYLGPMLIWARVSMLGREAALEGGFGALAGRMLWGMWRYICLMGWIFVLTFALVILAMLIGMIFGVASGIGSLAGGDMAEGMSTGIALLMIPLYLAMIVPIVALMGGWMVTLNAEARDVHLSINRAFKMLGGKAWGLTGAIFMIWIVIAIPLLLLVFFLLPFIISGGLGVPSLIFLAAIFTFGGAIVNFTLLSIAGFYAAHLVPELKA